MSFRHDAELRELRERVDMLEKRVAEMESRRPGRPRKQEKAA